MSNLITTYASSKQESDSSTWLTLEQQYKESEAKASFADIAAMFSFALTGLDARHYITDDCPGRIEGDEVSVDLDFFVFPSRLGLPYSLTAGLGVISAATIALIPKEFDVVLELSEEAQLDFLMEDMRFEWISPAINDVGAVIEKPFISQNAGKIISSSPCFGVLRVDCLAVGFKHTLTMDFTKESGYSITNIKNKVQATFYDINGELQSESLDIVIPPCVENYLATCEGSGGAGTFLLNAGREERKTVYFNPCTGTVVKVVNE